MDVSESDLNLFERVTSEFEKPMIIKTLNHFNGNQIKAAKLLGINRNTLRSKIKKFNIDTKSTKNK